MNTGARQLSAEIFNGFAPAYSGQNTHPRERIRGLRGLTPLPASAMSFVPPAPSKLAASTHLQRLYLLHPPPYLPTQSAFIDVIRLIRDSDSDSSARPRSLLPVVHQLGYACIYRLARARCQRQRIPNLLSDVDLFHRGQSPRTECYSDNHFAYS